MKHLFTLFAAAFLIFAQDTTVTAIDTTADSTTTSADTNQIIDGSDLIDTTSDTNLVASDTTVVPADSADSADSVVNYRIFFAGVQTGDIPELRQKLEDMIRTRWRTASNISFVNPTVSARIVGKMFADGDIVADSLFFAELTKQKLGNTVVLLIRVDEYSVNPVRRMLFGAGVEGKLKADFLFFDVASQQELFAAKLSSISIVKKAPIGWHSPKERVHVSTDDLKTINSELLDDIVEQGFEAMKIAVSSKK